MKFLKYLLPLLLVSFTANATLNEVDKAMGLSRNMLDNSGFELGKTKWTASGGTFALVTAGSNLLYGANSITWDSGAAAQTLTATAVTIPKGAYNKNGMGYCSIQTPSGTATHKIQIYDGTNVIAEQVITSSTTPIKDVLNFPIPATGSLSLRLISVASDEPLIAIDDCYLGEAVNLSQNAQMQFAGASYYPGTASCTWSRTVIASPTAFATQSACPGPTIETQALGSWQTTDADLPQQTINNLPAGNYFVVVNGSGDNSVTPGCFSLNDGTTTSSERGCLGTTATGWTVQGHFSYTNSGNRTFAVFGNSAGTLTINNTNTSMHRLTFTVYRVPSASESSFNPDALANSWSGYHDTTCSWARTNTAYGDPTADASCALVERTNNNFGVVSTSGSVLPAITFTPKRIGRYYVCASPTVLSSGGAALGARLFDGTTTVAESEWDGTSSDNLRLSICGIYSAASTAAVTLSVQTRIVSGSVTIAAITGGASSSVEWSIFQVDQNFPMPNLTKPISAYEAVVIDAITTAPTKATTRQFDRVSWYRDGKFAVIHYEYEQDAGTGGAGGSGNYLLKMPAGLPLIDTTLVPPETSTANPEATGNHAKLEASLNVADNANFYVYGIVSVYDTTHIRIMGRTAGGATQFWGSASAFPFSGVVHVFGWVRVPMQGWQ